ncbi:TIGR02186 family protein [Sedimentitalea sp. HM32M-2]|uniref:TIGR02186 family protein n=1 Tax=Sedimentitalea sp. HM32M-2 TaxID=3351566 RepID=UPI00363C489D
MRLLICLSLLLIPCLSAAEEVVLGLSKDKVAITTSFDGSEILIFGAVKREKPIPTDGPLHVVITVAGPSQPITVRRKSNVFGIWVNTEAVEVDRAPSFYSVASTGPLEQVLSNTEDLRHKITVDKAIRSVGAPANVSDASSFTDAIIRIRRNSGLYQHLEGQVALDQQTLFRTAIEMPANLTEGDYATRIFLTRNGRIVSQYETSIDVRKVGLERWLFTLSREQPLLYGLMSLAIAIAAGWGASTAFRLLRN